MAAKKILIVEDEADQREFLSTLLSDNGYDIVTAENGQIGFDKAKTESPDLITLDISMDEQSGVKTFRQLQEAPETKDIPVVMVTGVTPEFKRFIETRKQVDPPAGYVEKPVDQAELLKKIKELIG